MPMIAAFMWRSKDGSVHPCSCCLTRSPWGDLTAIDSAGALFSANLMNVTAKEIPQTGTSNIGGSLDMAGGLLFIAATNDSRFRAFDKTLASVCGSGGSWQAAAPLP